MAPLHGHLQRGELLSLFSFPSISSKELTELIERLQKNADQVEKNIVETDSRMQNVSMSCGPVRASAPQRWEGDHVALWPACPSLLHGSSAEGGPHLAPTPRHVSMDAVSLPSVIISPRSLPAQDLHKIKACQLAQYKELTAQKLTESDKLLYVLDGDAAVARHMKHPQGDMITEE